MDEKLKEIVESQLEYMFLCIREEYGKPLSHVDVTELFVIFYRQLERHRIGYKGQ